ncbi:hypothetical protein CR513_04861, partial [Mucuna pruriens]
MGHTKNLTGCTKMRGMKGHKGKGGEKKSLIERGKKGDMRRNLAKTREEKGTMRRHVETEEMRRISGELLWMLSSVEFLHFQKMVIYALVWWNQFYREIREGRRRHADTWPNLKREMRLRFLLASYVRDLYKRLQRVYQGSKSVEEYYKDMEVTLMRANIVESNEATMAYFRHILNREI